jgi:molybdenum cofactor guanylyltransferase
MTKLHGLVLSGGESRRMGTDKGLIKENFDTWVNRAGALLRQQGLPVAVMIRESQEEAYTKILADGLELLQDQDLPVGGPLKGMLSFYQAYPGVDVLVLPCDMPQVPAGLLKELIDFYTTHSASDAWVFSTPERIHPFPGIYSGRYLQKIGEDLARGALTRYSLMYLLESGNTALNKKPEAQSTVFLNLNSPEDRLKNG